MTHARLISAALGSFLAAAGTALAQEDHTTLYTPAIGAGLHNCNAVNVSHRTLRLTIFVLDQNGHALAATPPTPTPPGAELSNDYGTADQPIDACCKVEAFGTANPGDLRVVDASVLIRTFDEGSQTNIPVFVTRTVVGY